MTNSRIIRKTLKIENFSRILIFREFFVNISQNFCKFLRIFRYRLCEESVSFSPHVSNYSISITNAIINRNGKLAKFMTSWFGRGRLMLMVLLCITNSIQMWLSNLSPVHLVTPLLLFEFQFYNFQVPSDLHEQFNNFRVPSDLHVSHLRISGFPLTFMSCLTISRFNPIFMSCLTISKSLWPS